MSKYTPADLKQKLIEKLNAKHVEVIDESDGCGMKFNCIIVADCFKDLNLLKRHRLVNAALAEELKEIHAFSQKTFTPEQWQLEQQQQ